MQDIALAARADMKVASADHAWKMIAKQEERIKIVRAFVAKQEAHVESGAVAVDSGAVGATCDKVR